MITDLAGWTVHSGTAYEAGSGTTAASRAGTNGTLAFTRGPTSPQVLFGRPAKLVRAEICYLAGLLDTGVFANSTVVVSNADAPKNGCLVLTPATPYAVTPGFPLLASISTNNVSGTSYLMVGRITATWVS